MRKAGLYSALLVVSAFGCGSSDAPAPDTTPDASDEAGFDGSTDGATTDATDAHVATAVQQPICSVDRWC